MSYQEIHQEPYTKYPNRYNDTIKPRLTDTQRDICDVVIRMTYGWHQTSAEISNSVFIGRTSKSKQGIIKAKKQLEEMGILIVLGKGGGSKTNEYMLDLWYDNPDKSVRASMLRQEEQLQELEESSPVEEQEDIPQLPEDPVAVMNKPGELQLDQENPITGSEEQIKEPEIPSEETQVQAPVEEIPGPASSICKAEISDTGSVENPGSIEAHELPTSKLSLPPSEEDINNISGGKEKHTAINPENGEPKKGRKKAAATVRYKFFSIFPEAKKDKDWAFFGWVAKEYGIEACLAKLDYMKEHRKQHSITNPKGFFRTALVRNFQPPAFIVTKLRADETAKREMERCRRESEEWQQITANFNYESAAASLQKLLDSLS